ncbi:hypothetical protein LAZ40_17795 [Cereibacter sphaeroides]|uniref:hypothetical protein n=1 Tax=Rhodobacterales TaxID=204455 RepID=UPI000BBE7886|nr:MULTISPECIES: hypothetical protein [Paracoccaceae]MCE6960881.1 hypothetical protein [Cereibacter sphaeroides]MCE6969821.1 hypothetical protein [Cereibacter sphaeroides]MCE6975296.1 hypothetical protein [Cereibacter sphaeroides]
MVKAGSAIVAGAALAALLAVAGSAQAEQRSFSIFAGILTDNTWEDYFLTPWETDPQDPGLLGIAFTQPLGRGFDTRFGEVRWEIEFQIVRHAGVQSNWEFNLPIAARLMPEKPVLGVFDTMAFGIGPSHADKEPALELARGDAAQKDQVYWYAEVERRSRERDCCSFFARIHHRSDAYGLIGEGGSSNGLVVGMRTTF